MQKFGTINFEHGVDPRYIAQEDKSRAEKWLHDTLLYNLPNEYETTQLILKLKAYDPFSFTIKVYEEGDASNPFVFHRFRPDIAFGENFAGYMRCVKQDALGYPSSGQRRKNNKDRRVFHDNMTSQFEDILRFLHIDFKETDPKQINSNLRSIVEVMMSFHPDFNQRLDPSPFKLGRQPN